MNKEKITTSKLNRLRRQAFLGILKWVLCMVIAFAVTTCLLRSNRMSWALKQGNLKQAESCLSKMSDSAKRRHYGGFLIDEYLAIGNLDKALYVFDRLTEHGSAYYSVSGTTEREKYTATYYAKLYKALIEAGRYDEAWHYHRLEFYGEDNAANASCYFSYMTDVITAMCNSGRENEVPRFIKQHGLWFMKNIDNDSYGRQEYPEYLYNSACNELNKVFNNAK